MLGALLGLANLIVIAAGIAVSIGGGAEAFVVVTILGAVPALLVGIVLGAVATRTRDWSIGARYAVIGIPALAAVVLLGCVIIPLAYYIPFALLPTCVAVRIVERRTRAVTLLPPAVAWNPRDIALGDPQVPPAEPRALPGASYASPGASYASPGASYASPGASYASPGASYASPGASYASPGALHPARNLLRAPRFDPVIAGMLLGLLTLTIVAIGMNGISLGSHHDAHHHGTASCSHPHPGAPGIVVFIAGLLPAMITGAVLGRIAHRCRGWATWARCLVLVPPPLVVVVALGGLTGLYDYVLPAMIPTLVAALWLERATRSAVLPVARTI